ncbi:MAG: SH3 domain-containing protein [Chloroflexota bacterium]
MVASALSIVLLVLAGLALVIALILLWRALSVRSSISKQPYDVGLVEAKRTSQAQLLAAGASFIIGLIFLGAFLIVPRGETTAEAEPGVPVLPTPAVEIAPTSAATPVLANPAVATIAPALPTDPPPTATIGATETPAPTEPAGPTTATVSSGVGVWLRSAPSTTSEQLEWLLDGSVVTLLDGQETADEFLWQQVQAESGVQGWVAWDFLIVNEPAP